MRPESGNRDTRAPKRESIRQRFLRTRADDSLPLTITHERIYILPSRRGWWFVASLMIMLVASIKYNLSLGYALCFLLTGLFSATLLATYRNLSGLTVAAAHAVEVHAGEALEWEIRIATTNPRFGLDLTTAGHTTRTNLEPGKSYQSGRPAPCTVRHLISTSHRGLQALGRVTLSSDYPLGLWYTWCYLHPNHTSLVLPALLQNPPAWPQTTRSCSNQFVEDERLAITGTGPGNGETVGLRAYREGDSLATIAWKNAARGQGLHVRDIAATVLPDSLVFDWQMSAVESDPEARLSLLATWVKLAHQRQQQWSLSLPGVNQPRGSGRAHFNESMQILALYDERAQTPTDISGSNTTIGQ
ncbi:MAG: DUF58 domain-containing protein [Gammaproteobacteria bacterium]|nr:DUF58 domain-containing protein [Gammaproteobacteria bacterium]